MQPAQCCVMPMARAISSLCLALTRPPAMEALANCAKPCMASPCDFRNGPRLSLMLLIRPMESNVLITLLAFENQPNSANSLLYVVTMANLVLLKPRACVHQALLT